jgi:2-polyprenyl-6-methoxyphenol hydroxylase-like FAD-dependent oxidoreductase
MSGTGVSPAYDLVISGGSLGGAALALAMAGYGARVLVLERETRFGERLRGECLVPWGVAEARSLGIDRPLHGSGSVRTVGLWESHVGTGDPIRRDMAETTLQRLPSLTFYHPDMQEALLAAAADAGAEVRRGVTVEGVQSGTRPTVIASCNGTKEEIPTRLSVGADGRSSRLRGKAGFRSRRDPLRLRISGVLLAGSKAPRDRIIIARKRLLRRNSPKSRQNYWCNI